MRFQNVFGVFADFLNSAVSQAKRILFDSNKIVCPDLSCSGQASALIKKETRLQSNRVSKKQTMVNQMWQSYKLKGVSGSSSDMVLRRLN